LGQAPVILYGAGESSHWFVEVVMREFGFVPEVVLDKRFSKVTTYEGVPALHPDLYTPSEAQLKESIVVICSGSMETADEIRSELKAKGYQNLIPLHAIYEVHNPFSQPEALLSKGFSFYMENKRQIEDGFDLFSDVESQQVFLAFLQTHMTRKPVEIPRQPREEQYFPSDLVLNKGYSRFVSCGAYDGDTVRLLNDQQGKIDELVCFEADPEIFKRLTHYLSSNKNELANNITALPCATYCHEQIVNFTEATGLGSRVAEHGGLKVQAVSLDNILPTLAPTMITMDIEGVEPEALKGAEKMIREHKPDLAICVYHSPNHLWEIPLYLNSLDLGYKFYIRNYTSFTIETVLYATV
jgi:FkbM family methyltransferase